MMRHKSSSTYLGFSLLFLRNLDRICVNIYNSKYVRKIFFGKKNIKFELSILIQIKVLEVVWKVDHEQNFSKILFTVSKYAVVNYSLSLFAGPPTPRFNVECLPDNTAEEKSVEIQH